MIYGNYIKKNIYQETSPISFEELNEIIVRESLDINIAASAVTEVAVFNEGAKDFFKTIFEKLKQLAKKVRDFIMKLISKVASLIGKAANKYFKRKDIDIRMYNGAVFTYKNYIDRFLKFNVKNNALSKFSLYALKITNAVVKLSNSSSKGNNLYDEIDDVRRKTYEEFNGGLDIIKEYIDIGNKKYAQRIKSAKSFQDITSTLSDYIKNAEEIQFDVSRSKKVINQLQDYNSRVTKTQETMRSMLSEALGKMDRSTETIEKLCGSVSRKFNDGEASNLLSKLVKGYSMIVTYCYKTCEVVASTDVMLSTKARSNFEMIFNKAFS